MASFLLATTVGAVLNAAAFTGGSYLAHFLSGKDQDGERERHDRAVEQYDRDYNAWKESMAKEEEWKEEQEEKEHDAAVKFKSTDDAFRYYAQTHPDVNLKEPQLSDYYAPSKDQRNGELAFTVGTVAAAAWTISRFM